MPILLSCSRGPCMFIIGGSHVHVCIYVHCTHAPKYILLGIENTNESRMEICWSNYVDTLHNKRAQWPHRADRWLSWDWTHCCISIQNRTYLVFWIHVNLAGKVVGWGFIFYWSRYVLVHIIRHRSFVFNVISVVLGSKCKYMTTWDENELRILYIALIWSPFDRTVLKRSNLLWIKVLSK